MTTIRLSSGMTLPTGSRHAGADRLSAGVAVIRQMLDRAVHAFDVRRARADAIRRAIEADAAHRAQRYEDGYARLPRGLGD
jgi:hypothetical protein